MHACLHTYILTYLHTHIHTYTHTYIHTDRQTDSQPASQPASQAGRQAASQPASQAGRQAGRQTDIHTDGRTDGRTDRRTDRHIPPFTHFRHCQIWFSKRTPCEDSMGTMSPTRLYRRVFAPMSAWKIPVFTWNIISLRHLNGKRCLMQLLSIPILFVQMMFP